MKFHALLISFAFVVTTSSTYANKELDLKDTRFYQYDVRFQNCVPSDLSQLIKAYEFFGHKYKVTDNRKVNGMIVDATIEKYDEFGNVVLRGRFIRGQEQCNRFYAVANNIIEQQRIQKNIEIELKYN